MSRLETLIVRLLNWADRKLFHQLPTIYRYDMTDEQYRKWRHKMDVNSRYGKDGQR